MLLSFRWVDQCANEEHDFNRRTRKYSMVGQNCGSRHDGVHITIFCDCATKIINGWYDEVSTQNNLIVLENDLKSDSNYYYNLN